MVEGLRRILVFILFCFIFSLAPWASAQNYSDQEIDGAIAHLNSMSDGLNGLLQACEQEISFDMRPNADPTSEINFPRCDQFSGEVLRGAHESNQISQRFNLRIPPLNASPLAGAMNVSEVLALSREIFLRLKERNVQQVIQLNGVKNENSFVGPPNMGRSEPKSPGGGSSAQQPSTKAPGKDPGEVADPEILSIASDVQEKYSQMCMTAEQISSRKCRDLKIILDQHCTGVNDGSPAGRQACKDKYAIYLSQLNYSAPEVNEAEIYAVESQAAENCQTKKNEAAHCCGPNAMSCALGMDKDSDSEATAGLAALIVQSSMSGNSQSLSESCGQLKNLGTAGAGINTTIGMKCRSTRTECKDTCEQIKKEVDTMVTTCMNSNGYYNCSNEIRLKKLQTSLQSNINVCENFSQQEGQYLSQAGQSMAGRQIADLCEGKSSVIPMTDVSMSGVPSWDCADPSNASNPYCLAQTCSQAGSENKPECANYNSNKPETPTNNGSGSGEYAAFPSGGVNEGFEGDNSYAETQGYMGNGDGEIGQESADAGSGSGGGGPSGGGSSGGSAGGQGYGGGGSGSKGYKTSIAQGYGGGGYSSKAGSRLESGSGGGYSGNYQRRPANDDDFKFNLKQFLPGGKKDPRRKIAGFGGTGYLKGKGIGDKHGNIWENISNKYQQMCLLNKLYCAPKNPSRFNK